MIRDLLAKVITRKNADLASSVVSKYEKDLNAGVDVYGKANEVATCVPLALKSSAASARFKALAGIMEDTYAKVNPVHYEREVGRGRLSSNELFDVLKNEYNLKMVDKANLSYDREHHFDMYGNGNGGFGGSRSYDTAGKTSICSIEVLQPEKRSEDSPAVVRLNFHVPNHLDLSGCLKETPFKSWSGSKSLFVVPKLSSINSLLTGNVVTDKAGSMLKEWLTDLQSNSALSCHDYTEGYGEVGTISNWKLEVPSNGVEITDDHTKIGGKILHSFFAFSNSNSPSGFEVDGRNHYDLTAICVDNAISQIFDSGAKTKSVELPSPAVEGAKGAAKGAWRYGRYGLIVSAILGGLSIFAAPAMPLLLALTPSLALASGGALLGGGANALFSSYDFDKAKSSVNSATQQNAV